MRLVCRRSTQPAVSTNVLALVQTADRLAEGRRDAAVTVRNVESCECQQEGCLTYHVLEIKQLHVTLFLALRSTSSRLQPHLPK